MTSELHQMVLEFHEATNSWVNVRDQKVRELRTTLILEEAYEAVDALQTEGWEQIAHELADLVYVTFGAAIALGIDLDGALRAMHASNMSKLDNGQPVVREDGKIIKGPNYRKPNMAPYVLDLS